MEKCKDMINSRWAHSLIALNDLSAFYWIGGNDGR